MYVDTFVQCKYCNSNKITKNGHDSKGNQRYKCIECNHTFSEKSRRWIPFEFISFVLHRYYDRSLEGKRNYFPTFVNSFLKLIDYESVHRTTIYSWINKYKKRDLISADDATEWFDKNRIKKLPEKSREIQKKLTPKEEAHKKYAEAKLLGTHIETLTWIQNIIGKETFKVLEKYSPETIKELTDSFQFKKYRENKVKIDTIVRKRNIFDS
ncbi:MAG TPA: hypothetical protein VMX17_03530 [Candidatus Glassbacteria bacterium]|nr:hypothetical protein [Candidatus Glassbacteria bacterium]